MHQLRKVGGTTASTATRNALRSLMTSGLMAQFNKNGGGSKGKRGLKGSKVYHLILGQYFRSGICNKVRIKSYFYTDHDIIQ